jgi:hypothetical protein
VDRQRLSTFLGEALARNLNGEEKRILNFVAENHKISVSQCLKLLPSLSKWHSAKKFLMKLVSKGLLSYVQDGKTRSNKSQFTLPEAFRDPKKRIIQSSKLLPNNHLEENSFGG